MDDDSIGKILSVRESIRAMARSVEEIAEQVRASHAAVEGLLRSRCPQEWCSEAKADRGFFRPCGTVRRPENCEHAVWVTNTNGRDYCLSCKFEKTPELCTRHEWVSGPTDMDGKRSYFCLRCGAEQ